LQKISEAAFSPQHARALRTLEVLERTGSPEAKSALEELAKGAAEAELTREAKATLERLAKRPRSEP
jgi:hypothetical protein